MAFDGGFAHISTYLEQSAGKRNAKPSIGGAAAKATRTTIPLGERANCSLNIYEQIFG